MKVIVYFKLLNSIGGVESWLYYLSKKYEFEFWYKEGDPIQVQRLAKNIKVKKYNGEQLECDTFIVNYNPDIIDNVKAKEYIMMVHCDYSAVNFRPITHPKFTKYIGVSQYVCDVFTKLTNIPCELCYNPVYLDKPKVEKDKKLHLLSMTRLSSEKGGWRIDKLASILDKKGIDYTWTIFTNKSPRFQSKNIEIKPPKLDLTEEITKASYVVQLSDAEAFCLSVVESLTLGTPVIVTDLPVYKELGLNEDNSITIPLMFNDFDIDKLKDRKFTYTPPKDNWNKYLPTKKTYNPKELVKVKVLHKYTDIFLNKKCLKDEIVEMPIERASYLESKDLVCFFQ
jgi:glycosyltransferase involved in cell wall biosynthesis